MTPPPTRPDSEPAGIDFRAVFDRSPLPMLLADDDRRYVAANPAAATALGVAAERLLGRRVDDLTPAGRGNGLDEAWLRFLDSGTMSGTVEIAVPGQRTVRFDYSAIADVAPHRHLSILVPASRLATEPRHDAGGRLSARERQILSRVAQGRDGPQIAKELVVSPATVRTHIGNAIRKLEAHSRAHAIAIALRAGLLDDDL